MTDKRTPPRLTMIGLRPESEEPFPLQPYRDVFVHTPSHARPLRERGSEPTPVYLPPGRRLTNEQLDARSRLRAEHDLRRKARELAQLEPSFWSKMLAATVVCYAVAILFGLMYLR